MENNFRQPVVLLIMTTTFRVHAGELDQDFFERLKAMFKGKEIEIIVQEADENDETAYLLRSEANRKHLLEAKEYAENGKEMVDVDIKSLR